ncbi:PP2C family protein-serine/threonine phosphatase [Massilia cavernae]|uniref:Serine/threonine-protein phosphatase n=1 Tax=Massilia cavernae TaxID=2320864 RepID=A0A418Y788_9BURK|nr:protein phosphatase 2C domain-containing protein [Massilia cavernae]RJG25382.1 serine/threonine-protein phosphatase [Massilia cavernae]
MSSYRIEAGTAQHIGSRAQQNDRAALFSGARAPGYVLAVLADGQSGGPIAPEQVLHTAKLVFDEFKPGDSTSVERLEQLLRDIVHESHLVIKMNGVTTGTEPHCSFVGLVITPQGQAVWAHVGDSRLYRFAGRQCQARTSDAAYLQHLLDTTSLTPDSARMHRQSELLNNVLGNVNKEPFVVTGSHEALAAGDSFLLCSDGLWQYFTDPELGAALNKNTPRQASELLINKAIERAAGKGDNCTMAMVKLVNPPKEVQNYTVQKMRRAV